MDINPQILKGNWKEGFALDLHTTSSFPHKDEEGNNILDGNGNIKWNTTYTPIGEQMNHLKYWKEKHRAENIGIAAVEFLKQQSWDLDLFIPMPPSDTTRLYQPVYEIAKHISVKSGLSVDFDLLKKLKPTTELKGIEDEEKRKEMLKDVFSIDSNCLAGKNILIFDDLYRSGGTLKAVCEVVLNKANPKNVYVLTVTKTRTKR